MILIVNNGAAYFAALNTGRGFISYFSEIFDEIDTVYVIKGGSGTGKSRLMRQISAAANQRGYPCEEFLCSSDPTSLDGVIIPRLGVAVVDGTLPHAYEPKMIGAKERIIDLSAFLDCARLKENKERIEALVTAKGRRYRQIYEYLSVLDTYDRIIGGLLKEAVSRDKLQKAVSKSALWLKKSETYVKRTRIRSAFGTGGVTVLNTYALRAKKRFAIADLCGLGHEYLLSLLEYSEREGISFDVSYDPFCPDSPDALYYPETDVAFYIGSEDGFDETLINMRRFVDDTRLRPFKPEIRAVNKLKSGVKAQLALDFAAVSRLHFALEEIYSSSMNFASKEKLTDKLIFEIFK